MTMRTVSEIHGTKKIYAVSETLTVQEAAQMMFEHDIGALMVVDKKGTLHGIVSERDIVRKGVATRCNLCDLTVGEVMTRKIMVCNPDDTYQTGLAKMREANCRHLPIVKDGKPLGMVSMRDLMGESISECHFDVTMLKNYIAS
ncbi:MAG: CBS domain-containing protein [Deltaproteobacteria bacterium]|nr:CBS domain-containing protein [Deltaproteobacteria bacterium]